MERPRPEKDGDKFDIVSLSLVLNYVSSAEERGQMLRRTCAFLRKGNVSPHGNQLAALLPSLFLVLPAPCITNSRYLDEDLLNDIMGALGYTLLRRKISAKLAYYLFRYDIITAGPLRAFNKTEVNPGKTRNNFCITLR